nr:MAG TPA: hypothetical protein [Caudoviricetes sp.]
MRRTRTRMSARVWKSNYRRTAQGTCPHGGAEGGKPQQKHHFGWKAEKSRVG